LFFYQYGFVDENIGGPTYQIHPVNTPSVPNCSSLGVCPKSSYFNFDQDFGKIY
jgi:hypothetical protein